MSDQPSPSGSSGSSLQDVEPSEESDKMDTSTHGGHEEGDFIAGPGGPSDSSTLESRSDPELRRGDSCAMETSTDDLREVSSSTDPGTDSVMEPQASSSAASASATAGPSTSGNIDRNLAIMVYRESYSRSVDKQLAKLYFKSYPTPIMYHDLLDRYTYYRVFEQTLTNWAILAFQVENFTSYAAHFCKYERRRGREIVSVGCGDGSIEREIIKSYRGHFGVEAGELNITLVDPNPFYKVDFTYVDRLIAARPSVVGNCSIFIIWPQYETDNSGYDIDAVRRLQPHAALVLYEPNEISGSKELTAYLRRETKEPDGDDGGWWRKMFKKTDFGLSNYTVELVASQEVFMKAGEKSMTEADCITEPGLRAYGMRMVKLTRND